MKLYLVLPQVIFLICTAKCANILFVGPMPAHSHFTVIFRLAKEMADRDHQVTVINPFPQKHPIKNYKDIIVEEVVAYLEELRKELLNDEKLGVVANIQGTFEMTLKITELTFESKNVHKLLNSNETFDVVVIEHFMNEAFVGIAHHFKAPVIMVSSVGAWEMNNFLVANPAPTAYVPNLMSTFTRYMHFWQRLQNLFFNSALELMREFLYMPQQRELFKKYIKTDLALDDVLYNISLMLTNSHVSVNDPIPLVPGIVEIGGYHVSPPKKLPRELQEFLDNSKQGVILFAMGSNLKSKDLNPNVRSAVLKAFSKLEQNVLWKFEEELSELPANVKIMKWVPQQDVLAHPNVRAFISHGGLLSTIEAVYYGVPVIGIPVFGDQKNNIARAENNGYAIGLPLNQITEESFSAALKEILHNPKYRENVKKRSNLMHDRPVKPIDLAVYWIEHVIRHKGASHLRSAGLDLKWYQRHMIDVAVFLSLVTVAIFVSLFVLTRKICRLCSKNKAHKIQEKKNK